MPPVWIFILFNSKWGTKKGAFIPPFYDCCYFAAFLTVLSSFFTGFAAAPQPPHPHFSAILCTPRFYFNIANRFN
jgi:hypothetical protein